MDDRPTPLVFAHRGSSADLPEHTLAAYLRALTDGADGLECDVRLTRDGHLVCVHDRRLERTSTGRGRVSRHTLAQLDQYDYGSWHPGGVTDGGPVDADRTRLLTLDTLLDTVRSAGRRIELLIETKHPTRYGAQVERRLVAMLNRHGLTAPDVDSPVRVTVMSFSPLALRRLRYLAPQLPAVLLMEYLPPVLRLPRRLPFGVRIGGPGINLLRARPDLVPALRTAGNQVYVWTVNEPAELDLALGYEVDGIITDRPTMVIDRLELLGRRVPSDKDHVADDAAHAEPHARRGPSGTGGAAGGPGRQPTGAGAAEADRRPTAEAGR